MAPEATVLSLEDRDLPPLFRATDSSSIRAQASYLWLSGRRLWLLITAGVVGLFNGIGARSRPDWPAVIAAVIFFSAGAIEAYLLKTSPQKSWYEGRAAAESVKTLSWRYAVAGEPFELSLGDVEAENLFLRRLDEVMEELRNLNVTAPTSADSQITPAMRRLRSAGLDERKQAYETGRVANQQQWYSQKANWNALWAGRWSLAMLAIEVFGGVVATLRAAGVINIDLLGIAAVTTAAIAAWQQTKQYENLAAAYSVTTQELASVHAKIAWQKNETDWAKFVSDAEEAFSREHTLWKASRGMRPSAKHAGTSTDPGRPARD